MVTSQYQPRLSSVSQFFSRRISQLDCSIHIKLNYQILLTVVGFDRMVRTADIAQLPYVEATLMEVQRLANTGIQ